MVTGVIEQVPRYTIRHTDDGRQERLHLTVCLPGLTSAKDFEVRIENDRFILRAEGRYNLTLPLHPPVEQTAEVLQFVKRKALLKAELKVLPASDQAAEPVSPSSSAASSSIGDEADGFRRRHGRKHAPDPETDDEAVPDLLSNDSGSSPTFSSPDAFPGHAHGTAFTASGRRMSPDSDSDQSDTSPHVGRWSNGAGPMPAAEDLADAAMPSNPLYGVSPASQAPHGGTESSDDDVDHSEHPYHPFQQPQTQQTLEAAAAYCKQAFDSLYACDWRRAANLLLEAQLLEGSTSGLVHMGMGGLPGSLAADVCRNVGACLLESIEERMQANGSGAAKTVRGAWEQAHAALLLQAIGHPAAAKYGLPGPPPASTDSRQEQRTPQAKPPGRSTFSQPSDSSFPRADAAHSSGTQPSAAGQPSPAPSAQAHQDTNGSETSEQEQQQGQWAPAPTPASYGPAEQAEAKRQANKEAALTWLDKARAAAANKDYTAAVQKAQKGLSLDPDAEWAGEANRLIQSWQAVQQKQAGSSGPADKQSGGSKPHAQAGKGQQQQQGKKQTKRQKRQAQQQQQAKQQKQEQQAKQQQQQQQQQAKQQEQQQQPKQEQQQQSSSAQHKRPREEASGDGASRSAAHGQYSYTYGPEGQRTESAEPRMNSPPAEHFEWLSAVLPLMKHAAGCARRGCRLLLHGFVRSAVIGAAFVLLCLLMVPQIPAGLLYLTGRRDWCHQLAAARKAGKVWAKLVYFVLSPLLGVVATSVVSSFVSRGSFTGSFVLTISWVAWPLVKAWEQLISATSWLHPSRASIHVILLIARVVTRPSWVRYLSSGLLLWWSLHGGWTAVATTLLASLVSYMVCLETLGTPVAFKLSHVASTNTYITGYFYRAVMLILVWGCWVFWQTLWRECTGPADQSQADADPPPKPASGAPRPAQPGPTRTSSTDAKTEVARILAAKTHYAVLEVEHSADVDTVKRAKKTKSLLVHPDKAGNLAGAGDAFGKVIDAAEVLSDPSKKRQYDAEQAAAAYKPSQPAAPPRRPQEEDDPNVSWQVCPLCEQLHRAVKTDMAQNDARWCKECNAYHTVQKGEGWVTRRGRGWLSFMGGDEYVVYACLWPDGQIYDVTEQCICQGMLDCAAFRQLGPDCHHVWLHFSNPEAANRRQRYQPPDQSTGGRKKSKKAPRRRR